MTFEVSFCTEAFNLIGFFLFCRCFTIHCLLICTLFIVLGLGPMVSEKLSIDKLSNSLSVKLTRENVSDLSFFAEFRRVIGNEKVSAAEEVSEVSCGLDNGLSFDIDCWE